MRRFGEECVLVHSLALLGSGYNLNRVRRPPPGLGP